MAFKLKSGNTTAFKQMGSSPAKQMTDFSNVTINDEDADAVKERNRKEREEEKKRKEKEAQDLIDNPDQSMNKHKFRDMKPQSI